MYYNSNDAKDFAFLTGRTKLGIEKVPRLVTRGLALDMAADFGLEHLEFCQRLMVEDVAQHSASKEAVDTWRLDVTPSPDPNHPFLAPVVLLKENDSCVLETMNTAPLVGDGASDLLFVLGQGTVRGILWMTTNWVAILCRQDNAHPSRGALGALRVLILALPCTMTRACSPLPARLGGARS